MNNKRYQLPKKYYLISLIKSAIMLQKFLVYTTLWILFQLLIEINCQMIPFKPRIRQGHTATLIHLRSVKSKRTLKK
jgi:hypothetical protein